MVKLWYDHPGAPYAPPPVTPSEYEEFIASFTALPDGSTLPVRGRDRIGLIQDVFSEWELGVCMKYSEVEGDVSRAYCFFLWGSGRVERFAVSLVDWTDLVHLVHPHWLREREELLTRCSSSHEGEGGEREGEGEGEGEEERRERRRRRERVVLLAHGWSPIVGAAYPLLRTLQYEAERAGWSAVVPSFLDSYRLGEARSRSERVRVLLEEILCMDPRPKKIVVVGHSQGGAAASLLCTDRVVRSARIVGLLLIGSESPLEMDGMDFVPPVKNIEIIHAKHDVVVSCNYVHQIAQRWGVPLTILPSRSEEYFPLPNEDDIHHDFLSQDLLFPLLDRFRMFLDRCEEREKSAE
jgi:hypothetical protein